MLSAAIAQSRANALPVTSWATTPGRRRTMQGIRSRDTRPELLIRRAVFARGLRYRVDSRPLSGLNRRADLVFARAKVAVFVHGCFWHGCPKHYIAPSQNREYWASKVRTNQKRDSETSSVLKASGWRVVTIWEHEDPERAAVRIEQLVRLYAERLPGAR